MFERFQSEAVTLISKLCLCLQAIAEQTYESKATWTGWLNEYRAKLRAEGRPEVERVKEMNAANPCYVPRNHLLQDCIEAAEMGDYTEVRTNTL